MGRSPDGCNAADACQPLSFKQTQTCKKRLCSVQPNEELEEHAEALLQHLKDRRSPRVRWCLHLVCQVDTKFPTFQQEYIPWGVYLAALRMLHLPWCS